MSKTDIQKLLPDIVKTILVMTNGWLVGSAIKNIMEKELVKDYDIIVKSKAFSRCLSIFRHYKPEINHYGGITFVVDNIKIQIWLSSLEKYLITAKECYYVYNAKNKILIEVKDE
jgi:hypothetical protein